MQDGKEYFDMKEIKAGDIIEYLTIEGEKGAFIERGIAQEDNLYEDGVFVQGDGWKQYVGKWFMQNVVRDGISIWKADNYDEARI